MAVPKVPSVSTWPRRKVDAWDSALSCGTDMGCEDTGTWGDMGTWGDVEDTGDT